MKENGARPPLAQQRADQNIDFFNSIQPMLEFDTTDNKFRDELQQVPLDIQGQIKNTGGYVDIPDAPGIGVEPDMAFIRHFAVGN
ncbi:MAG: hypothetical protein GKR99_18915 [Rhodobacteraceae bacterium]|nr:hypothetical protein [Paracoccaceae bacterium]